MKKSLKNDNITVSTYTSNSLRSAKLTPEMLSPK